jgi:hypothetical protein
MFEIEKERSPTGFVALIVVPVRSDCGPAFSSFESTW